MSKKQKNSWIWSRDEVAERFPHPITPMGWSILQDAFELNLKQMSAELGVQTFKPEEISRVFDGYVYSRKPFFGNIWNLKLKPQAVLQTLFAVLKAIGKSLIYCLKINKYKIFFKLSFQLHLYEFLIAKKIKSAIQTWDATSLKAIQEMQKSQKEYTYSTIQIPQDWNSAVHTLRGRGNKFMELDFAVYFLKKVQFDLLSNICKALKVNTLDTLKSQNIFFKYQNLLLENSKNFQSFLDHFGHWTDNWDIYAGTLKDSYERAHQFYQVWLNLRTPASNSQNVIWEALNILCHNLKPSRKAELFKLMEEFFYSFQKLIDIDEDFRFYSSLQYPSIRALLQKTGEYLQKQGYLASSDHVYFLSLDEVQECLKNQSEKSIIEALTLSRKADYLHAFKISPPYELLPNGDTFYSKPISTSQLIGEVAVHGPAVEGKVKIIKNLNDCKNISSPVIAILETPNPMFLPYYQFFSAIVCETGSLLSHGVLLARELQIPTIIGVQNATHNLKDEMHIKIDTKINSIEPKILKPYSDAKKDSHA